MYTSNITNLCFWQPRVIVVNEINVYLELFDPLVLVFDCIDVHLELCDPLLVVVDFIDILNLINFISRLLWNALSPNTSCLAIATHSWSSTLLSLLPFLLGSGVRIYLFLNGHGVVSFLPFPLSSEIRMYLLLLGSKIRIYLLITRYITDPLILMVDYVDVYLEYCAPLFLVVDRVDNHFEYIFTPHEIIDHLLLAL
jgi:hypothetical protein